MLDVKEINNPEGWAIHFCIPMSKLEQKPLTGEQTRILIQLHAIGDKFTFPEGEKPYALKILEGRLPIYKIQFTDAAKLFVASLALTPGQITMMLTYIAWKISTANTKIVNIEYLCTDVFANGVPSEEDMSNLWIGQKVNGNPDNLLDHVTAGQSILSIL